jgi:hypothetical protein
MTIRTLLPNLLIRSPLLSNGVILNFTIQQENLTMKLKKGQLAPDFTLPSHLDKTVTLSHLRGHNVVLAFFPAAWTPT